LRFLVDANLSPRVAARLRSAGHVGLLTADDQTILAHASGADADFVTLIAVGRRRAATFACVS